ncbi:hypothetical protein G7046_g2955 [Stylonectria norvegica]|nr:hypothetical protein G7046_g2955 [Stylonectria norvegica]
MVFYYFGRDSASWAVGNDKFGLSNNLPPALQAIWDGLGEPFEDKQMAATRIHWLSTAPDGTFAVMTKNGDLLSNCDDLLNAIKAQIEQSYGTSVDHISFSPLGGWFIRYADGTVQLSGRFPDAFYAIASNYLDLSALASRQLSSLETVFFGAEQSILVKAGSALHWDGIAPALADVLTTFTSGQFVSSNYRLGNRTVLCPWSTEHYFLEAIPFLQDVSEYPFNLPDPLSQELLVHITSNVRPPQHLIPLDNHNHPPGGSLAQPSAPNQSSIAAREPSDVIGLQTGDRSVVPELARKRFEKQFDAHSRGGQHIDDDQAVAIFLESGLSQETLVKVWDLVDVDRNGKLSKDEFVQAMWHIDAQRGSSTLFNTARLTDGGIFCDGCACGVNIGEEVFFCSICNGGDFDMCQACYSEKGRRCKHSTMSKAPIKLRQEPPSRYTLGNSVSCDGCGTEVRSGNLVYWCQICSGGDYDICEACWKVRRTCGHTLALRKLEAAGNVSDPASLPQTTLPNGYSQPASIPAWDLFNTPGVNQASTQGNPSDMDKLSKQFNDTKLKDSLLSSILSEKPNIKWDDVAGLEGAKDELQEAIIFPIRFPHMFRGKRQARRALLLYGPPGTGKSYLAKAVATEVDHTLFSISSSDIMSKWVGESEGLMRQLFTLARERKPSIIFIDEIDAICSARDGAGATTEDTARMKTEFMVQMDGVGNNNDGVFVLAATNLPWALDPAVRRRFQQRIHAPLPDGGARRQLFKVHLGGMSSTLGDTERAFADLSRITVGYSGSDIANLIQDALMIPIKKVHTATHFRKIRDQDGEWYTPCTPLASGSMPMKWNQIPSRELKEPPLLMDHLYEAVRKVKPSVGEEEVRKCNEWTTLYGREGA